MPSSLVLKAQARQLGFTNCGVTRPDVELGWGAYRDWLAHGMAAGMGYLHDHLELKRSADRLLPGTQSVIVVTLNYAQPVEHAETQAKVAAYAQGRDYHKVIRTKLRRLAEWIQSVSPGADCRPCVDSAPILERAYAHQAGLGWFGKNTMLIDSRRGSWFFIGVLLTTAEFEVDAPSEGGCGTCMACVEACPTGAIVQQDGRWQVDARQCVSYLTIEHRGDFTAVQAAAIGEWTFGCDVCQTVCPFNQPRESQPLRAAPTEEADFRRGQPWPELAELAQIPEPAWDELTRGSALRRTGIEGLRRNARANLANRTKS